MVYQLRASSPTARKTHPCDWCYTTIQPGERYHRSTNIYDDRLYDWVSCLACQALLLAVWDWAYGPDEGVDESSFAEWAQDHLDDPEHGGKARAYLERRRGADAWFRPEEAR